MVFKIEELSYKPQTYYLFNTQVTHTVYNFETTRYLLSIEFAKNKEQLSYEELLKEVMANYE
jgi:phage anti-repressor protein